MPNTKKAWIEIVKAEDLDNHLKAIGQAEANASLVKEMFKEFPLNGKLLVPGCGTGQLFDFVSPEDFGKTEFVFTDVNKEFLDKLEERMSRFSHVEFSSRIDDIEESKLKEKFEGILLILLLQHIDWKKGLTQMLSFSPKRLYFIIQEPPENGRAVNTERELPESIREFCKHCSIELVQKKALSGELKKHGFKLLAEYSKSVPDEKRMLALVFERQE